MRADNSQHIVEAARRRSEYTRSKAVQALRALDAAGEPVTFETVAKRARVSRSWLYAQPDLRTEIEHLRAAHRRAPASPVPARQRTSDASLLRRLEAANTRIRRLTEENQQLREQLAGTLGELRTLRHRAAVR
ncbi:MAG: transposase [Streptosporangiaceae bacterium]|nr:transposase [Streptosporangiaceae bacterium]